MTVYGVWRNVWFYSEPNMPPQAITDNGAALDDLLAFITTAPAVMWHPRQRPFLARLNESSGRWEGWRYVNHDGTLDEPVWVTRANSQDKGTVFDRCRYEGRKFNGGVGYQDPKPDDFRLCTVLVQPGEGSFSKQDPV